MGFRNVIHPPGATVEIIKRSLTLIDWNVIGHHSYIKQYKPE